MVRHGAIANLELFAGHITENACTVSARHSAISSLAPMELFASVARLHELNPAPVAALVVMLVLVWFFLLPSRAQRAVAHLPRPLTALPLVGDTLTVLTRHRHTMPTWVYEECLRLRSQPFAVDILSKPPIVVLSSVEAMEDVLKLQADHFVKGDEFTQALGDLFGRGIFVTDGEAWHAQRTAAHRLLAPPKVRAMMESVMPHKTARLCEILRNAAERKEAVDMKRVFELFATDVFTALGFGVDLDFMADQHAEFFERFGRANDNTLFRQQQPRMLWKLLRLLNLGDEKTHRDDVAWLDRFVFKMIQDAMARETPTGTTRHDLVSVFLENHNGDDVTAIRDMAMAFISAGRDTTAYSMTWFLIMMAQHPPVQHKIRQELREKLPHFFTDRHIPTKDETATLTYLEACILESLRINPVIPLNTRENEADVTLRDGTFLAAGTKVMIPIYAMARLPWIWGDDALDYKPERWLEADGKVKTFSSFQFLTFSAGPRICPGKQFSILEMKIALAAVLSQVEIATEKDPFEYMYEPSLALGIQGPVKIQPTLVH